MLRKFKRHYSEVAWHVSHWVYRWRSASEAYQLNHARDSRSCTLRTRHPLILRRASSACLEIKWKTYRHSHNSPELVRTQVRRMCQILRAKPQKSTVEQKELRPGGDHRRWNSEHSTRLAGYPVSSLREQLARTPRGIARTSLMGFNRGMFCNLQ